MFPRFLIRPARPALFLLFLQVVGVPHAHATGFAAGGSGLIIRSADHGENWSASNPAPVTLNAVHFVSDQRGWAVGNSGTLIRTDDGGGSWTQSSPGVLNLNDVFFADADYGWIVGDGGKVLRSSDGGANWTTTTPTTAALHAVYFLDRTTGWAAGQGVVLRTTNGGASWTAAAPSTATLRDVRFLDASNGWVVGGNGLVLKSSNGGTTWTSSAPTTSALHALHFADLSNGWAVGASGTVLRTSNGGASWSEQRPVATELRAVYFIDDRFGWACGAGGAMLRTIDGGTSWVVSNPALVTLNDVFFASVPSGVSVTVATDPPGLAFTVDGVGYSAAHTFLWDPASPHTIATAALQPAGAGTRQVWESWSDGGAISHAVSPAQNTTLVARFTTEHELVVQSGANGSVEPAGGWYAAGSEVLVTATPDPGYGFNGWTGSGAGSYSGWANPASVTVDGPVSESAAFGTTVTVVVDCAPPGRTFSVDGVTYATSQQFTWVPGTTHALDVTSPQGASADTRFVFARWSDGGGAAHDVAPVSNTVFTVTYRAQYTLTTTAGTGGRVTPAGGWYDAGTVVTLTATADSGYVFQRWTGSGSGSYTGAANPRAITVNGPVTQQALFVPGSGAGTPPALTLLTSAPNPFAGETDIRFGLPRDGSVRIDVFDVAGRRVRTDAVAGVTGWQSYRLDANAPGGRLRTGIYFVRVSAAGSAATTRVLLLR